MGNDPTDKNAENPIPVDVDAAINTDAIDDTKRKRKKTSKVWIDFTEYKDANGNDKALCKHCKKSFVGESTSGTSHLAQHLKRCNAKIYKDSGQKSVMTMKKSDGSTHIEAFKFDQDRSRMDLARMVIKHNYPFNIVDHEFFEHFCKGLRPEFRLVSRNTVRSDIIKLHEEMKKRVYEKIDGIGCRVTLTTDIWTSDSQNFAYACLTAHYIDNDWELQKTILNYKWIVWPHDGESLFRFIPQLIMEWNLDKKLFSMVVDDASSNDSMVRHLKSWLSNRVPCAGDFFHVRCSAHILNLVVQDGLLLIRPLLDDIRATVRYLNKSPYGKQKFDLVVSQLKLQGQKKIPMDVSTRWDSTYDMLDVALNYEEACNRLEGMDKNYKFNPSKEEWRVARLVHGCLKMFKDATVHFSGTKYPTANVFFPDICDINIQLMEMENSPEEFVRLMAGPMKIKFSKYWDECCLCLAIAVILDPRFKMDIIEYYYDRLYGKDLSYSRVQKIRTAFFDLYIEYGGRVISTESFIGDDLGTDDLMHSSRATRSTISENNKLSDFKKWKERERLIGSRYVPKSEFDQYLEEETHPTVGKFNILTWWAVNGSRFPIISKIARDVLAVPATTVASESAFSIGGRVIDESRSCLLPDAVEALITTSDWIPSRRNLTVQMYPNEIAETEKQVES